MATTGPHQQPTPERFFNAINAYEQTEAMKAAVELEIFTAIDEGNTTAATIAKRCEAAERGVRTLCDFLTIHGFLTKEGAQYALAPDSALFLNRHSPAYIGTAIEFLLAPLLREGHARLTEAELESISNSAGFAPVELAPPEIGLDRLVIAYR